MMALKIERIDTIPLIIATLEKMNVVPRCFKWVDGYSQLSIVDSFLTRRAWP